MRKAPKKYLLQFGNGEWTLQRLEDGETISLHIPAELSTVLAHLERQGILKGAISYARPVRRLKRKCDSFDGPMEESPLFKDVMKK